MITVRGLEQLGFVCRGIDPVSPYDFALQDDGEGVYISEWHSKKPKPTEKKLKKLMQSGRKTMMQSNTKETGNIQN